MKRMLIAGAALFAAALPLLAKEVTAHVDAKAVPRQFYATGWGCEKGSDYSDGFLRVGYAADPVAGGEEAALRCRKAGAWTFRTTKCDDETLAFCSRYALRIVLVLEGDLKTCGANLARIGKGPHASAICGVQLGNDPTGGTDEDIKKWRALAASVRRNLPGVPIALPVRDETSPILAKLIGTVPNVTHLAVDLTDAPAPYERLKKISIALRRSPDRTLRTLKLWAVAPGERKGLTNVQEVSWRMHWIFSAFAVERTDGVFFARDYKSDDFGRALRHLWVTVAVHPYLMGHAEGSSAPSEAAKPATRPAVTAADIDLEPAGVSGIDDIEDEEDRSPAPQACANAAEGRLGDLELLVFAEHPGEDEPGRSQMCVAAVNTSGEAVDLTLKINTKTGYLGGGYWRWMLPDPKADTFVTLTHPRGPRNKHEFVETIRPGEIAFLDFRLW